MRKHLALLSAALLTTTGLTSVGCDRNDKGPGDTGTSQSPSDNRTGLGGTGTADTTTGAGASNGVSGNETRTGITVPGNTPNGVGITTRPASESSGPQFENGTEGSKSPQTQRSSEDSGGSGS